MTGISASTNLFFPDTLLLAIVDYEFISTESSVGICEITSIGMNKWGVGIPSTSY